MAAFGSGTNEGLSGTFDCGQPVSRVSAKSTGSAVKKCFMVCSRKNHQVPQPPAVQGARLRAVGTWHEDTPVLASREAGCSPGACQEGAREPVKAVLHRGPSFAGLGRRPVRRSAQAVQLVPADRHRHAQPGPARTRHCRRFLIRVHEVLDGPRRLAGDLACDLNSEGPLDGVGSCPLLPQDGGAGPLRVLRAPGLL